jgi:hypothetical protein
MQQQPVKSSLTHAPLPMPPGACRPQQRRDRLLHRKTQIEAQLASIDARERLARSKRETRTNIVIGAIMRAHASLNPGFAEQLADILDNGLNRPADRALLAAVLGLSRLAPGEAGSSDRTPSQAPLPCPSRAAGAQAPDRPREVPPSRLRQHAVEITARR